MSETRLILFEDARARAWAPFTVTRPAGELLFGASSLRDRAEGATRTPCAGVVADPSLEGFDEAGAPPLLTHRAAGELSGRRIVLSSRLALPMQGVEWPDGPATLTVGSARVGWILPEGAPLPDEAALLHPDAAPHVHPEVDVEGRLLETPWDLLRWNADQLRADALSLWDETGTPEGVVRIGAGMVSVAQGAEIEPGVVVDVRHGPVRLERGVRVEGPARLVGPLHIGRDSLVFGGQIGTSSVGPACKLRGEVADSVLLGYVNKAHDGYLGHALLGKWVNLGALTTNSDLKNNYGPVSVWTPEGMVDTGLMKVGCFLGDHVKTGIGTLLNTGTVIGAGSNVFGGAMPPTHVPPFSWGAGAELTDYRLDKFLESASKAMARRDVDMTDGTRRLLERAWHASAEARKRGP